MLRNRWGPKSASMSGSVSLRSWRSTVWTVVIAHGKTASRTSLRRPASKAVGATRSAKYASRNEKVWRSEEHTSELQSQSNLVCRLLLEKKKKKKKQKVSRQHTEKHTHVNTT